MYCNTCGQQMHAGARFCDQCGDPVVSSSPLFKRGSTRTQRASNDPYKDQIAELKLQIKELKLHLRQITTNMSSTRARYNQTAAFVPHGLLRRGYKWFEDIRLLGPQQQKERLQQEIMNLEQQLLSLEQAQRQWKMAGRA